jgi:hypothetical protein
MDIGWRSTRAFIALVMLSIFSKTAGQTNMALAAEGSTNGAAGQMPAYYDGELFTVNMKELSETASASIIGNNPTLNEMQETLPPLPADPDESAPAAPDVTRVTEETLDRLDSRAMAPWCAHFASITAAGWHACVQSRAVRGIKQWAERRGPEERE